MVGCAKQLFRPVRGPHPLGIRCFGNRGLWNPSEPGTADYLPSYSIVAGTRRAHRFSGAHSRFYRARSSVLLYIQRVRIEAVRNPNSTRHFTSAHFKFHVTAQRYEPLNFSLSFIKLFDITRVLSNSNLDQPQQIKWRMLCILRDTYYGLLKI